MTNLVKTSHYLPLVPYIFTFVQFVPLETQSPFLFLATSLKVHCSCVKMLYNKLQFYCPIKLLLTGCSLVYMSLHFNKLVYFSLGDLLLVYRALVRELRMGRGKRFFFFSCRNLHCLAPPFSVSVPVTPSPCLPCPDFWTSVFQA